ncbi:HAD domain-containing protein [Cellulosimicrobium sp. I38E]|uniref:HAD domain-containing protein n=1 Tax=Cellulosimicrobium sp. I38E TaxID=1393139 RepID=UPI0012E8582D|nr:HAD domain-containing protein [Cellulosimicrobium sp. I38E]
MLILDLDGVISPFGSEAKDGMAVARVGGYLLLYRPDVIAGLNALNNEGDVQLRWLTSWGDDARTHVAPALGLSDFPLVGEDTSAPPRGSWPKLRIVLMNVTATTRFAWIDDDLTPARQRRIHRALGSEQCLLLRPEGRTGLTTHGLDRARIFLASSGRKDDHKARWER